MSEDVSMTSKVNPNSANSNSDDLINDLDSIVYKLEESIGFNVRHFTKQLRFRILSNFKENGIKVSIEEWICLAFIFRYEDRNQNQLGDLLMQDKTAVTRLLDTMESKKQVRRLIDRRDKRNRIIKLTAEGKRQYNKLRPIVEYTIATAKKNISEQDYNTTVETLRKMCINLE